LSIFPLTAVVTMPLRISISSVPFWQILLTMLLMWGSAIGSLALAARTFRLGMLQFNLRISLKKILRKGRA
jgi:ABC-2 type transport system permease protein